MFIVNHEERQKINNGEKWATLRPIRPSGKGYFKKGSLQMFCEGRDFKNGIFNRGLILERFETNINFLTSADFLALGYPNKAEYLAQPYNQGNPSPYRVRYDFVTLPHFLEEVESLEICPQNFFYIWDLIKEARELTQGVNKSLIFEGCNIADLEDSFITIQANIEGAKI